MLKVVELFAGYGSQALALERLREDTGLEFEVIGISEIDRYALQAYEALHGKANNLGDICKIDKLPQCDLITYSFPCQDISVAGKQKGLTEGSGTRSGLLWEVERLLDAAEQKPKYLLMENVKNLVSKKFMPEFRKWQHRLEMMGYTNYTKILNAKDYGIPQNRERVFMISILGEHKAYQFPEPFDNGLRLIDFLEDEVEERYYIGRENIEKLLKSLNKGKGIERCDEASDIYTNDSVAFSKSALPGMSRTLKAEKHDSAAVIPWTVEKKILGNINPSGKDINGNVYDAMQAGPTLTTNKGEGPKVAIPYMVEKKILRAERTEYGKNIRHDYEKGLISESRHNMTALQPRKDDMSNTITTVQKDNMLLEKAIPCLTPDRLEKRQNGRRFKEDGEPMFTLTGQDRHGILEVKQVGNYREKETGFTNPQTGRVYSTQGISPTLNTMQGGDRQPKVLVTSKDFMNKYCVEKDDLYYAIRKLTPRECFRLMGLHDSDIDKIQTAGISNSQQYKMAGNSIVVDVLEAIFRQLFLK